MKKLILFAVMISAMTAGCSFADVPGVPYVTLNDGNKVPVLGLGTWTQDDTTAEKSVYTAIRAGYRLIDTARYYGNEAGVGKGVCRAIREGDNHAGGYFHHLKDYAGKLREPRQSYRQLK